MTIGRRIPNVVRTPADARFWLHQLWRSGELNWFLGAQPEDFGSWHARKTGSRYVFTPPDSRPPVEFERELLRELISRGYARLNRKSRLLDSTPEDVLRKGLSKAANQRFTLLLRRPFWREITGYGGEFFHVACRRAIYDEDEAERWIELDDRCRLAGASLPAVAEFVTRNYTTVWLFYVFQRALDQGGLPWRRQINLTRYGSSTVKLLEPGSPYSAELKGQLQQEYDRFRNPEFGKGLRRRKVAEEKRFFGNTTDEFFGRRLRHEDDESKQQWPYFRQEIVNVVSHLKIGGVRGVYPTTGNLLNLVAPDWFGNPRADSVRTRYQKAIKRPTEAGGPFSPTPIPDLGAPPWQTSSAALIPQ